MNIIVFSEIVKGHYPEYLQHIYNECVNNSNNFIFVVPEEFNNIKHRYNMPETRNISYDFITHKEQSDILGGSLIKTSFQICKVLNKRIVKYNASKVLACTLIGLVPFAPIIINRNVKISGIIYNIYLYRWRQASLFTKVLDVLKYLIMSKSGIYENVLVLNDNASARYLNSKYRSSKFKSIIDPYLPIAEDKEIDMYKKFGISKQKFIIAHFGSLMEDKGTFDILRSIDLLTKKQKENIVFIIAGQVREDAKTEFYSIYDGIKDKSNIILIDQFCSYDFLASLCKNSSAILIPYHRTSQSSGVIGYASQFGCPVIAPNKGLLGKLVKNYQLGITIKDTSPSALIDAYDLILDRKVRRPDNSYCLTHRVNDFQSTIKCLIS